MLVGAFHLTLSEATLFSVLFASAVGGIGRVIWKHHRFIREIKGRPSADGIPGTPSVLEEMACLKQDMVDTKGMVKEVHEQLTTLNHGTTVRSAVTELRTGLSDLKSDVAGIRADFMAHGQDNARQFAEINTQLATR